MGQVLRQRIAIERDVEDIGDSSIAPIYRAPGLRLEEVLREGLDIRWNQPAIGFRSSELHGVSVPLKATDASRSPFVIDALGVRPRLRRVLSSEPKPNILPYVVVKGKRLMKVFRFYYTFTRLFSDSTTIEHRLSNGTLLRLSVEGWRHSKDSTISVSYIYSRPAYEHDDLFRPARISLEASDIPKAFYKELQGLEKLSPPFNSIFDAGTVRQDPLVKWLMRSSLISLVEWQRIAEAGVVMTGNACHARPILGGEGANLAITDGLELADCIVTHGTHNLAGFGLLKHGQSQAGVARSEQALQDMHLVAAPFENPSHATIEWKQMQGMLF